jgi:uncharacterized protein (TIGR02266 family)
VGRKKILLADDVELFLELEKTFFRREEFELVVARSGKQACKRVENERPDLVFMDLFMPEMDGDQACRWIKAQQDLADIPVVMVTQGGREEDLARCWDAGCDDIVLKPINRHHFVATARKHLQVVDRGAPRVKARVRIRYGSDPAKLLTDFSVNVSTGGVYIETLHVLAAETPLALEFLLPNRGEPVRCTGRVAWANGADNRVKPDLPPGMGVQFIDLRLEDLHTVREFIKQECLSPSW